MFYWPLNVYDNLMFSIAAATRNFKIYKQKTWFFQNRRLA